MVARDEVGQRRSGKLLHREERTTVGADAELVDRHDRGVIEAALDARLAEEPAHREFRGVAFAHALDRDLASDLNVPGREHLALAALADRLAELVALAAQHRCDLRRQPALDRRRFGRRAVARWLLARHRRMLSSSRWLSSQTCRDEIVVAVFL